MSLSQSKTLAKNTLYLTIGQFGAKIVTFLLVPMYTSVLSTREYGTADLITTTVSLLYYFFSLNIADGVMRYVIDKPKKKEAIFKYGAKIIITGMSLLTLLLFFLKKLQIIKLSINACIFVLLLLFGYSFYQLLICYLQAVNKMKSVSIAGFLMTVVVVVGNIFFLLVLKIGINGYLLSSVCGYFVTILLMLNHAGVKQIIISKEKIEPNLKIDIKKYSIPLIFNGIAWWINNSSDRYMITFFCDVTITGIYSVAYKIPTILIVFVTIFSQAWGLSAIREFDKNDENGFFANTYNVYSAVLIIASSVLILLNYPLACMLFKKEFFYAWKYSGVLIFSVLFSALSSFLGAVFSAVKDTKFFAVSSVMTAGINILLNWILIPVMGAVGAAIATTSSFFALWVVRYVFSKKYIKLQIRITRDIIAYTILTLQVIFGFFYYRNVQLQIISVIIIICLCHYEIKQVITKTLGFIVRFRRKK